MIEFDWVDGKESKQGVRFANLLRTGTRTVAWLRRTHVIVKLLIKKIHPCRADKLSCAGNRLEAIPGSEPSWPLLPGWLSLIMTTIRLFWKRICQFERFPDWWVWCFTWNFWNSSRVFTSNLKDFENEAANCRLEVPQSPPRPSWDLLRLRKSHNWWTSRAI